MRILIFLWIIRVGRLRRSSTSLRSSVGILSLLWSITALLWSSWILSSSLLILLTELLTWLVNYLYWLAISRLLWLNDHLLLRLTKKLRLTKTLWLNYYLLWLTLNLLLRLHIDCLRLWLSEEHLLAVLVVGNLLGLNVLDDWLLVAATECATYSTT